MSDDSFGFAPPPFKPDEALRERVMKVLADPAATRTHMDVLSNSADDIVRVLDGDGAAERGKPGSPLVQAFETALKRLEADASLYVAAGEPSEQAGDFVRTSKMQLMGLAELAQLMRSQR